MDKYIDRLIQYLITRLKEDKKIIDNKFNNICDFLPLQYFNEKKQYFYVDVSPYMNPEKADKFRGCFFVKKKNIKYALVDFLEASQYCENIDITSSLLWHNHADAYTYYWVWVYALTTHIVHNKDRIPLMRNPNFSTYIMNMYDYMHNIIKTSPPIQIEDWQFYNRRSTRIVPDGLLQTRFYTLDDSHDNLEYQIKKIFLTEILYILHENHLVITNRIRE